MAKWLKARQDDYTKLVAKVQSIIVAVLKEEKQQRKAMGERMKIVNGYDVSRHYYGTATPPAQPDTGTEGISLDMVLAIGGVHTYMSQQGLYECVHRFLQHSKWHVLREDEGDLGTIWLELFIQFDIGGWRHSEAAFVPDKEARRRAKQRRAKNNAANISRVSDGAGSLTKPCFRKELANFKAMVRSIIANDVILEQQDMFKQALVQKWKFREMAIKGQQPAIRAIRQTSVAERERVEAAVFFKGWALGASTSQPSEKALTSIVGEVASFESNLFGLNLMTSHR